MSKKLGFHIITKLQSTVFWNTTKRLPEEKYMIESKINSIILTYKNDWGTGFNYRYEYDPIYNPFLIHIACLLVGDMGKNITEYREHLNTKPFQWGLNCDSIERVDHHILFGFDFSQEFEGIMHSDQYENLLSQWEIAYNDRPNEILLSMDEEKNFTITYQKPDRPRHQYNKEPNVKFLNLFKNPQEDYTPWFISTKDDYAEIVLENDKYHIYTKNDKLYALADLLFHIPVAECIDKLQVKPYSYYDWRYALTLIEDKIYIHDDGLEIKALPPFAKFIDLINQWELATPKNPELMKLYCDDDYNFQLYALEPVG